MIYQLSKSHLRDKQKKGNTMNVIHFTSPAYVERLIKNLVQASLKSQKAGKISEFQMANNGEIYKFIIDINRSPNDPLITEDFSMKGVLPLHVSVTLNIPRNGIEIEFSRYPNEAGEKLILKDLKRDGFHWSRRQKIWYRKNDGNFDYYKDKYTR